MAEQTIGLRDVYAAVQALRDELADMRGELRTLAARQQGAAERADDREASTRATLADHEGRLRSLERRAWILAGGAAAAGVAGGGLASLIGG